MLSLLAVYSLHAAIPLALYSWISAWKQKESPRRLPKLRPKLWLWAAIVVILAVDFTIAQASRAGQTHDAYVLCLFDAGVLLIPLAAAMLIELTVWHLWTLTVLVGVLALISI